MFQLTATTMDVFLSHNDGIRKLAGKKEREIKRDDLSPTKGHEPVVPGALVGQGEHRGYGLCPQQRPRQRCHSGKHFMYIIHI